MGEVVRATRRLSNEGFAFMLLNNDCQITLLKGENTIDFWPNTGRWLVRNARNKRRGIDNLIKFLKKD